MAFRSLVVVSYPVDSDLDLREIPHMQILEYLVIAGGPVNNRIWDNGNHISHTHTPLAL